MPLIRPFAGLRPVPEHAADVAAPPYDVLNTEEARQRAEGRPWSFLHISKPEIDLPAGTNPHDPAVYAKAASNLTHMRECGILRMDPKPCYYVYQMKMGDHVQTGLVIAASVIDYDSNRIRKHEFTRPDKEDDRVRQIGALNTQTGPVLLAYRSSRQVDGLLESLTGTMPDVDIVADDGIAHRLWVIDDDEVIDDISHRFDAMPALYIADGHHRSASASRIAAMRHANNPGHTGDESYNYFLAVAFPHSQMRILDYNRVVRDLNGLTPELLLEKIRAHFTVQQSQMPVRPAAHGEFGLYVAGQWYRLTIDSPLVPGDDPVARLDVSLLSTWVLDPLLAIHDPRRDSRIDFVGGIRGLGELEKRVDSREMAVAFAMYPTQMDDLMAVADAGEVMPPKSTWFEPKLVDGLVSHVLD